MALENPRWAGEDDRVYGVELVQFGDDDQELEREYLDLSAAYYQSIGVLQALVGRINDRRIDRRG